MPDERRDHDHILPECELHFKQLQAGQSKVAEEMHEDFRAFSAKFDRLDAYLRNGITTKLNDHRRAIDKLEGKVATQKWLVGLVLLGLMGATFAVWRF